MKKKIFLFFMILGIGFYHGFADTNQLTVCVSNNKTAPINGHRDIHVWVKNYGSALSGLTLDYFIEGKGTTHYAVQWDAHGEFKKTRNESWSTDGKRKITARLLIPGGAPILVNGNIEIHLIKPAFQSGLNVVCSDGKQYQESELFKQPLISPPLPLTVCVSNGKNPPIGGKRDIHAWVTNNGSIPIYGLTLYFTVEGKGIEAYPVGTLEGGLGGGRTFHVTRNHSWSTSGTKSITAMVLYPDKNGNILVKAAYKVSPLGAPTSSTGQNVKCSDGSVKTEADF